MRERQIDGCERKRWELVQRKLISEYQHRYLNESISDDTRKDIADCKKPHEVLASILLDSIRECNGSEGNIDEIVNKNMNDESFMNEFQRKVDRENRSYQQNILHNSKYV